MKRIVPVIIAATGLLLAGQVQSQPTPPTPPPPRGDSGQHFNKLSQELNLSDQQKPQVQAIFQEMTQKIQAAVEQARTNADSQLQGVLTSDQYQKLQNMWEQHQQKFERHWGHGDTNTTDNAQQ